MSRTWIIWVALACHAGCAEPNDKVPGPAEPGVLCPTPAPLRPVIRTKLFVDAEVDRKAQSPRLRLELLPIPDGSA